MQDVLALETRIDEGWISRHRHPSGSRSFTRSLPQASRCAIDETGEAFVNDGFDTIDSVDD